METAESQEKSKSKEKVKLKFENTLPREEAVAYFQAIVDSLKSGALSFTQGMESVELSPADTVEIEVKASRKGTSEKVSFELEWDTAEARLEISTPAQETLDT